MNIEIYKEGGRSIIAFKDVLGNPIKIKFDYESEAQDFAVILLKEWGAI